MKAEKSVAQDVDRILDEWYDESPTGTALVLGYREPLSKLLAKAYRLGLGVLAEQQAHVAETQSCRSTHTKIGTAAWKREPACECDNCTKYRRSGIPQQAFTQAAREIRRLEKALNETQSALATERQRRAQVETALRRVREMAGSHTVMLDDPHPAGFLAIYRTADAALNALEDSHEHKFGESGICSCGEFQVSDGPTASQEATLEKP